MRISRRQSVSHLAFNMTPLVDVVFLLIVFFVMTLNFSHLLIRKVELPLADKAKPELERTPAELIITVQNDNSLFVGRKPVPLQRLGKFLQKRILDPTGTTVTLRGDENLPYQTLQLVMEQVALSGVSRIHFAAYMEPPAPLMPESPNEITP
jgi:biopolymer transport protein TolR